MLQHGMKTRGDGRMKVYPPIPSHFAFGFLSSRPHLGGVFKCRHYWGDCFFYFKNEGQPGHQIFLHTEIPVSYKISSLSLISRCVSVISPPLLPPSIRLFFPMYILSIQTPTLETASIIELLLSALLCNCHPTSALTFGGFVSEGRHMCTQ